MPVVIEKVGAVSRSSLVALVSLLATSQAWGDAVTDWNVTAGVILMESKVSPSVANRAAAILHTAIYEATNAVTRRYVSELALECPPGASVDAAVATASRDVLLGLVPARKASIDAAYEAAMEKVAEGPSRSDGVAVGRKAAAAILAMRTDDGADAQEAYRPRTTPGVYVPTVIPAVPQWPKRKPWVMTSPDQFRPGPPPALDGAVWARDFVEVRDLGAKDSTKRTPEQTAIARFWEATLPPIYHGLVRSYAIDPRREVTQNARLFAAVTQASDDALIAVFDAKYHYSFWRPITAIRNGDLDGNDATVRDPSWTPFIDTPMHPEYPCAHCIVSGAVAAVLRAEVGAGPMPPLSTTSYTASGASRTWTSLDDFVREVAEARICDGVHYRNSTEVGTAMGRRIGELAAAKVLRQSSR